MGAGDVAVAVDLFATFHFELGNFHASTRCQTDQLFGMYHYVSTGFHSIIDVRSVR